MQDFDAARERALELALKHHMNGQAESKDVVETAQVFLDFLIRQTEADKSFRERLVRDLAGIAPAPQD